MTRFSILKNLADFGDLVKGFIIGGLGLETYNDGVLVQFIARDAEGNNLLEVEQAFEPNLDGAWVTKDSEGYKLTENGVTAIGGLTSLFNIARIDIILQSANVPKAGSTQFPEGNVTAEALEAEFKKRDLQDLYLEETLKKGELDEKQLADLEEFKNNAEFIGIGRTVKRIPGLQDRYTLNQTWTRLSGISLTDDVPGDYEFLVKLRSKNNIEEDYEVRYRKEEVLDIITAFATDATDEEKEKGLTGKAANSGKMLQLALKNNREFRIALDGYGRPYAAVDSGLESNTSIEIYELNYGIGEKGDKGEQGDAGPKGDQGDKGEQGPAGGFDAALVEEADTLADTDKVIVEHDDTIHNVHKSNTSNFDDFSFEGVNLTAGDFKLVTGTNQPPALDIGTNADPIITSNILLSPNVIGLGKTLTSSPSVRDVNLNGFDKASGPNQPIQKVFEIYDSVRQEFVNAAIILGGNKVVILSEHDVLALTLREISGITERQQSATFEAGWGQLKIRKIENGVEVLDTVNVGSYTFTLTGAGALPTRLLITGLDTSRGEKRATLSISDAYYEEITTSTKIRSAPLDRVYDKVRNIIGSETSDTKEQVAENKDDIVVLKNDLSSTKEVVVRNTESARSFRLELDNLHSEIDSQMGAFKLKIVGFQNKVFSLTPSIPAVGDSFLMELFVENPPDQELSILKSSATFNGFPITVLSTGRLTPRVNLIALSITDETTRQNIIRSVGNSRAFWFQFTAGDVESQIYALPARNPDGIRNRTQTKTFTVRNADFIRSPILKLLPGRTYEIKSIISYQGTGGSLTTHATNEYAIKYNKVNSDATLTPVNLGVPTRKLSSVRPEALAPLGRNPAQWNNWLNVNDIITVPNDAQNIGGRDQVWVEVFAPDGTHTLNLTVTVTELNNILLAGDLIT